PCTGWSRLVRARSPSPRCKTGESPRDPGLRRRRGERPCPSVCHRACMRARRSVSIRYGRECAAMSKPVAVLFDVDETLIHTGGSGARSWSAAFQRLYGVPADIGRHTSAGETDPQVARETFRGVLERDPSADELNQIYAHYLLHLAEDIWTSAQYMVLPG